MATSEVKRVIEPAKPTFKRGELVVTRSGKVILCEGDGVGTTLFNGTCIGNCADDHVGFYDTWQCEGAKPFKGSVTLTED